MKIMNLNFFSENDLKQEDIKKFFNSLHRDFDEIKPDLFKKNTVENASSLTLILNDLIREKDLYDMLGMSIGMFREDMRTEIQNRHNFSAWKANRVNRWILEVKYGEYIDFSKKPIPQYPSFSIFTNGTCASSEFIVVSIHYISVLTDLKKYMILIENLIQVNVHITK